MGLLGAHVSISGGISRSVGRARDLDCECFQIFSRNQRQWSPPPLDEDEVVKFRDEYSDSGIGPVLVHGSYLMNPASTKDSVRSRTIDALVDELNRVEALGLDRLVIHPGSHLGEGVKKGIEMVVGALDVAFENVPGESKVLLETMAGQGTSLGSNLEEISMINEMSDANERLAVCLDTCHMHSSGYNLNNAGTYEEFIEQLDSILGLDRVLGIHLNDSVNGIGSRKDRHANIGEGTIGTREFSLMVNDERFAEVPMVLETPGGPGKYRKELELLRSLRNS